MNTPSEAKPSQLDVSQAVLEAEEDSDELRPLSAIERTYATNGQAGAGLPRWGVCLLSVAAGAVLAALALGATARQRPDLRRRSVAWARDHLPRRGR